MVSSSTAVYTRPRARLRRVVAYLALIFIVAILGTVGWIYSIARLALPQLDGKLQVSGLANSVTVTRDSHGVPTIEALSLDDLFFAQGYITASDRMFQMDGMRRFAAGDLSEILGEDVVEHDRKQRIVGLRTAAQKAVAITTPENRRYFYAYARGVNAYINSHRDRLPLEFRILRYAPRPWTPEDSMLVAAQMVEDLSTSPKSALIREKILAKLGPELTADLFVNISSHDHPPTGLDSTLDKNSLNKNKASDDSQDDDDDEESGPANSVAMQSRPLDFSGAPSPADLGSEDPRFVVGSNNWVVSGAHTVSGKPLLSNDMHLGHQLPDLWYEAHLRSGNFDVAGVTLPGLPYVVVGHNRRIAWGFTNIGPTVEDAYIETFDASGRYLTPDGWKQPDHRTEIIKVKGKPDITLDVVLTRHGPIVSELAPGEARKIALRWTLYDGIRNPFLAVNSAQNWTEFRGAFSEFDAPAQNVVYADVHGNIGYQATGKIPIRASGDGSLPENGSDDAHEWTGYIPFDKLPSAYNPPSGILATANGRITPDRYPYSISTEWEAPWRSARVYRVLESGKKFSAADMLALETDIYSEFDRFCAERFVNAIDHAKNPPARAKDAAEILRQWDGRMTASSAAPTIETQARKQLVRLLLEPKLGPAPDDPKRAGAELNWKKYSWMMQSVWLENVLQQQPKRWLPQAYGSYEELLAAALEASVDGATTPKDLNSWAWGNANPLEIQHPIFGTIPILQHWAGPGLQPQSGSSYTVKAVSRSHGPSERMTLDLSDFDQSTLNIVTGEGGNFLSPYYMDQWNAWYEGSSFRWPFSSEAVKSTTIHRLTLEPSR
ncbi:MAG: Penicillin amidase [Acidobacteriaceae bacterium]|nr:Penicillin amidase [Acidobacteriaceae bacterium]